MLDTDFQPTVIRVFEDFLCNKIKAKSRHDLSTEEIFGLSEIFSTLNPPLGRGLFPKLLQVRLKQRFYVLPEFLAC